MMSTLQHCIHCCSPDQRGHIFVISYCQEIVALLELVDEVHPQSICPKGDHLSESEQDVEVASSMWEGSRVISDKINIADITVLKSNL